MVSRVAPAHKLSVATGAGANGSQMGGTLKQVGHWASIKSHQTVSISRRDGALGHFPQSQGDRELSWLCLLTCPARVPEKSCIQQGLVAPPWAAMLSKMAQPPSPPNPRASEVPREDRKESARCTCQALKLGRGTVPRGGRRLLLHLSAGPSLPPPPGACLPCPGSSSPCLLACSSPHGFLLHPLGFACFPW